MELLSARVDNTELNALLYIRQPYICYIYTLPFKQTLKRNLQLQQQNVNQGQKHLMAAKNVSPLA